MKIAPTQIGVGVVAVLSLGVLVFLFLSSQTTAEQPDSAIAPTEETTSRTSEVATASTSVPIVLVGEDGIPKSATAKQVSIPESNSLIIKFESQPNDIVLHREPWMDFKQFDIELTTLETQQKNQATEIQSNWSQIIASADSRTQMVAYIQDSIASVQTLKQSLAEVRSIVRNPPSDTTTEKKQILTSLDAVITDLLLLYDNQIKIKQQTLAAVQAKNVSKAVIAANDEDRMSLVISWHAKQYEDLFAQYKALVQ